MFSDEEIKSDSGFMRPDDELISIQEVCLVDKYDKKDFGFNTEPVLFNSGRSNLDVGRFFRDGFCESLEQQQAKFAWTEEDGNIASLFSSPGFGAGSSKELDDALSNEFKETDTSTENNEWKSNGVIFKTKSTNSNAVSSTSGNSSGDRPKGKNSCKIDKEDPRSRLHFVKYIKTHGRTIKLWECGICSREFQHQYTLMRHLPTHTDERNYHCDECSKSFRQLSTLSQHRAIHSAERPYSCEVCKKTFNRVSTLISHRKTHSEEKPYRCHICPKGFHQKGNLRNHLFTHTNERPYRCNICKKGYNQQSNLVCHKNKAHPDNKETISIERISCQTLPSTSKASKPTPKPRPECEVSSSMSPETAKQLNTSFSGLWSGGVIVDPIKTYHMSVAMATRQTPFALLQDDNGVKVLVKVVDSELLGGKQMLVPATAEDLRVGGKIVLKDQDSQDIQIESVPKGSALQIRVPVVATVVPKIAPGGGLHLAVEEPHHAYHSALSTDSKGSCITSEAHASCSKNVDANETIAIKQEIPSTSEIEEFQHVSSSGPVILSTYSLLPPAPSPPLDYIPLDLFESMACMPMGPQITTVNTDQPPSDESDIFITKFEDDSNTA